MKRILFSFLALVCCLSIGAAEAQILRELEKAATSKMVREGEQLLISLDSVDFQFAISLNQGAGFFDIEQKGETWARFRYSLKATEDKTVLEKARDTLVSGVSQYRIRRYETAENTIRRTKLLMEREGLTDEIVYLRVVSNLGLICLTQGKTAEAGTHITDALQQSEKDLGKSSPAYIANLNNMAKLYQIEGKYNEAEKAFDEAIRYADQVFGGGAPQAILLNNKAMLYQTLGQYDKAEDRMNAAIEAFEKAPKIGLEGSKSFDSRKFKANLASLYQVSGKYQESEKLFKELKEIYQNRKQTKSAEYAGLTNQMGRLYMQMGKMEQVRELLVASLNVYKKRWGENTIYFARAANDLGSFERSRGNYEEAEQWLNKSFSIRKKLLDPSHPEYTKNQEDLAILYWKLGKVKKAYPIYGDVMAKTIDIIDRFFPPMSEAEKTKFWDITAPRFQRFYNFALASHKENPEIIRDVFNYNMATKGMLLSATSRVRNSMLHSSDQQLIQDYLAWQDQKEQLSRLYSYSKGKLRVQKIDLAQLEEEANRMEKSLSERASGFVEAFNKNVNDYSSVAHVLNPDEVIVDVIRIRNFDQVFTDEVTYLAMICKNESTNPEFVLIENGKELENNQARFYRNAIQYTMEDLTSYEQFWSKIEAKIKDHKKVYFSPDGVYNQININTLYMPDGLFVLNHHDLILVGNSKDIFKLKNKKAAQTDNAFLLGYPDYGNPAISMLPGTKVEVDDISEILKSGGYKINKYMDKEATESAIKEMKSPGIVHIATHGYFKQDVSGAGNSIFGVSTENAANNPLLRSGLLLAGTGLTLSDTTSANIESNDNGILTAYEVLNLDLDATGLVVLSACETGLGEIKSGEGVYGLQRAFQVAGTDALIMSLWKVSDAATQKLMTYFYSNWVNMGDKQTAFRKAQLQLMEEYKEPYYWGAFVMIGG